MTVEYKPLDVPEPEETDSEVDPAANLPEPDPDMTDRDRRRAERKRVFVREYARTGSKVRAAKIAHGTADGKNPPVSLYARWAEIDPVFAEAVENAKQITIENLRERIMHLAMNDEYEVAISAGRIVKDDNGEPVMRKKRDSNALMSSARAYLPEFAKKVEVNQTVNVHKSGGVVGWSITHEDVQLLSREMSGQLAAIMRHIRQQRGEELSPERLERERSELIELQRTEESGEEIYE